MGLTREQQDEFQGLMADIRRYWSKLSEWELNFCSDQEERFAKYSGDIRLSPKQWETLRKIHEKVTDI